MCVCVCVCARVCVLRRFSALLIFKFLHRWQLYAKKCSIYVRRRTSDSIPLPRRTHDTRIHYSSTFQTQNYRDVDDIKNYRPIRRLIQNSRNVLQSIGHTKWGINLKNCWVVLSFLNSPGDESAFSGISEITKHMS